jgi:hypothetical protein
MDFDINILTQKSVRNLYYLLHKTSTVNNYTISLLKTLNMTFLIYPELAPNVMYISDWRIVLSTTNNDDVFIHVDKNKYKIAWDLTWDVICSIKMNVNWGNCNSVQEPDVQESLQEFLQEPDIPGVILEEKKESDIPGVILEESKESEKGGDTPNIISENIHSETPEIQPQKSYKKYFKLILCR